jgi:hypothetical protein
LNNPDLNDVNFPLFCLGLEYLLLSAILQRISRGEWLEWVRNSQSPCIETNGCYATYCVEKLFRHPSKLSFMGLQTINWSAFVDCSALYEADLFKVKI